MGLIKSVRGFTPVIGEGTFVAETAAIIGEVTVGRDCSIWFGTVLRGDVNRITIGDRVNLQDGVVVHTLYQRSVTEIGNDVSIGHNANIHGAKIEDRRYGGDDSGSCRCGHRVHRCGQFARVVEDRNRTGLYLCRSSGPESEGRIARTGPRHHRTDGS